MILRKTVLLPGFCAFVILAGGLGQQSPLAAAADAGTVNGIVFFDRNGDGVRDPDEPGFPGIVVTLFGKKTNKSSLYLVTRTDSKGRFAFPGELIGRDSTYTVSTGGAPRMAVIATSYHPARTFYTAIDGNDKNPGSREQPFRTIGHAVPLLEAGDLLYVRQGEYREHVSTVSRPLGGGSGWDRPIVLAGMPGETIVVRPPERDSGEPLVDLAFPRQQYLVFDNLVLDAADATVPFRSQSPDGKELPSSHIRLINCELAQSNRSAVSFVGDDHQFINCRIHDNGHAESDHGLIVSGARSLIHGCDIYHNAGCGICFSQAAPGTASNNLIRGNRIHDNSPTGAGSPGIGLRAGRKNLVYDNIIWGNPYGIVIDTRGSDEQILNNTIYGNRGPGVAIAGDKETHDNVVRNNILIRNREPNLFDSWSTTTVKDHNMVDGDPRFRDPEGNDFHLQAGSPAIDAGVAIPEVRTDFDGVPRPQGKAYDRGAYEYSEDSFVVTTGSHVSSIYAGQTHPILIGFTKKAASKVGR